MEQKKIKNGRGGSVCVYLNPLFWMFCYHLPANHQASQPASQIGLPADREIRMVLCLKYTTFFKQVTAVVGVMMGLWMSQTMATTADPHTVQLCGPQLANMLEIVCSGRGFHFKRAASFKVNPAKRTQWSQASNNDVTVVAECCYRRCTIPTLETYCAASDNPSSLPQAEILNYLNGNDRGHTTSVSSSTVFYPTTTMSSAHYDPNEPSAQVFRGPPAGSPNTPFFYILRGSRPTRTPLINK